MNEKIKELILEKIKEYETVIILRHTRPDGDAVGSTMGLAAMIRATYPGKRVFLDNGDYSEYLSFLGDEGVHPSDEDYKGALIIALDTGTTGRLSNQRSGDGDLLIKIDHHIDDSPYGDISWVEDERSSTCEMIAALADEKLKNRLLLDKTSASFLYTGLVTDSGRFRFRGTLPETMRTAALLMEYGINTEWIYANLYVDEFDAIKFRANIIKKVRITENGVAYIKITQKFREKYGISQETASSMISAMESIKGSLIWLAFIENGDGSTRVRLRSRFVEVQELATHYHGGGHACASGATVYSLKEEKALIADADALIKKYKAENTGWI